MPEERSKLPFHNLSERHRGVTPPIGECYTEAARVCLDRHHASPVEFELNDRGNSQNTLLEWHATDDRTKAAWGNETDATEAGAYACALAAIELTSELVAVRRAETKTGADYYIGPSGIGLDDLEECYRLEVSGVDKGSANAVQQRLRAKLDQAASGTSNLPAIASVVGFRARLVLLEPLERQ
jgi:hypothetical protein